MKKLPIAMFLTLLATTGMGLLNIKCPDTAQAAPIKYAVTTSKVKTGKGTLPKGTRVEVDYTVTQNGHRYAGVDGRKLSYQSRRQTGNQVGLQILTSQLKMVPSKASDSIWMLRKGKSYDSGKLNASSLIITTDNYVEYYRTGNLNVKPLSSTKLTGVRAKGQTTYLYAKTNMKKLPDRRIKKSGKYKYRLAIRNNHKRSGALSMSYSVGTLKNYFMKIVPGAASNTNNDFEGNLTIDYVHDYSGVAGIRKMVAASEKLVVGTVGESTEYDGSLSHYTKHQLVVGDTLKGTVEPTLTFIQAGTSKVSVTDSRLLKNGDRVILALQKDGHGDWTVMNGGQGMFVAMGTDGRTFTRVSDGEIVTPATFALGLIA